MDFDFSKLEGKIIEQYHTRAFFARQMGMDLTKLSNRLNNRYKFKPDEIVMMAELLNVPKSKYCEYFFTKKV